MGEQEPTTKHTLEDVLEVFAGVDPPGTPLATSEVADELGCARRTAYGKLEELAERGDLETKKVGARGRVWWRPRDRTISIEDGTAESFEEAQFQELVGAVTDYAIFVLDAEGRVQTWNDGASQIKGYEEDEIVGEHFSSFYTEEDQEAGRPERNLEAAVEGGRVEDEGWRVRSDGTQFWANVTITSVVDDDGELLGFVKVTRDMTERHEYEERLRRERDRFETLVREVEDYAIFLLDAEGRVQTWNEGARQLKGYEEEEILGEHFSAFYTDDDVEAGRPERNVETAIEDGRVEDEGLRVRNDGTTFWAHVVITALFDDDGDLRGFAKVTRDMTERHEYEQRLRDQRDELDDLNQINEVIRDVDQALVTATSREEIEEAVCERLAGSDPYVAAWIGEYTESYEEVTPRTWAGISDEYLEAIRTADGGDRTERGVGAKALETRTIQPVQELGTDAEGEPWRETSLEEGYESAVTVPLVHNDVEYGVLTVYAGRESAFDDRKIAVLAELGETISHAIAAIRRKEREQTLTALQNSTRELLTTETREEIGEVIVDTLTEELGIADAALFHFDTAENVLEPVSTSLGGAVRTSQLAPLTAGSDSPIWTSFVEGEVQVTDGVFGFAGPEGDRTVVVPLGDHGALAVAAAEGETLDGHARNLVELVGATAEAAFDRVDSQATLRERDELLQEQNRRLTRLNGINTIIREVDQGLVQATTREEVQRVVCERLAESDRFRFAWIGAPEDADGRIVPLVWSGEGRGYLDAIDRTADDGTADAEPAVRALATGDVAVVSNVAEHLRDGRWRKEAFSREFQSVIAVPLRYGDVTYGVLAVYADRPEVFEEMERAVFAELGETVANAINAVETKQALLGDHVVELEFQLGPGSSGFLPRLSRELDAAVALEGVIPLKEGRSRLFVVVRDGDPDDVRDALDRSVAVASSTVIAERESGTLVETVVDGPTVPEALLEEGASLRSLTATPDGTEVVVDLPSRTEVRGFIERFRDRFEDAEFSARRERERPLRSREGFRTELEEYLTERQLEVLETAYYGGYFDSPRQSTGGDVADLLDVTQPTVTEQLRAAQSKVLDVLFDERARDE